MKNLENILNELEEAIISQEKVNSTVSSSSVGWHIEHSLLVINSVITQMAKSDPSKYRWSFSFWRMLVFMTNKIPRGKAKAPKVVRPAESVPTNERLIAQLQLAKQQADVLETLSPNHYVEHPYFGHLNLQPTRKFLVIHSQHHLDIIRDVVKG
jgi:hypothetical protein